MAYVTPSTTAAPHDDPRTNLFIIVQTSRATKAAAVAHGSRYEANLSAKSANLASELWADWTAVFIDATEFS
mgnify:CR=1 FL=1